MQEGKRWKKFRPIPRFMSEMIQERAILTTADQWKVVYSLSNDAIFNDFEQPLTQFSRSHHFNTECPRDCTSCTRYRHSYNGSTPFSRVSCRMTLSDFEWLREIFNDTKRRAVSKALRHGSHSVTCNYTNACLYPVSVHQMAPPQTEVAHIKLQPTTHLSTPKG